MTSLLYVFEPSARVARSVTDDPAATPGTDTVSVDRAATCLTNMGLPTCTTYTWICCFSLFVTDSEICYCVVDAPEETST